MGFVPDGEGGCEAILPAAKCLPGQMAVPGDNDCHEVATCGNGDYGDIPVEANTQFVNGSYPENDSDGTEQKPWKAIQQGIDAAAKDAIVAVAAGSYQEHTTIAGKSVRLWGRCPALVEIVGTGSDSVVSVGKNASNSEIRNLAITGAGSGIDVSGSKNVLLDQTWVHDTNGLGVSVMASAGPTNLTIIGSLIELTRQLGVLVDNSSVLLQGTVVRDISTKANGQFGFGILAQSHPASKTATIATQNSLIERTHGAGIAAFGGQAMIESTVIRSTQTDGAGKFGYGILVQDSPDGKKRASVNLRSSLIEESRYAGVTIGGSDATIESTVVRTTGKISSDQKIAAGLLVSQDPITKQRSKVTISASLVQQNYYTGISLASSDVTIDATIVRATLPSGPTGDGLGILVGHEPNTKERSTAMIHFSLVEKNYSQGILLTGSTATIEATVVRDNQVDKNGNFGNGVRAEWDDLSKMRSDLTLRSSLVEANHEHGLAVVGSDATVETTIVRATQLKKNGESGTGVGIYSVPKTGERSNVSLTSLLVEENHFAGLAVRASDAIVRFCVVSDTLPEASGVAGTGIYIYGDQATKARSIATVFSSLVNKNRNAGILVIDSQVTVDATVVKNTLPDFNNKYGTGVAVQGRSTGERGDLALRSSLVENSFDRGVLVVGSDVVLDTTVVRTSGGAGIGIQPYPCNTCSPGANASNVTVRSSLAEDNHILGIGIFESEVSIADTAVRKTGFDADGNFGDGISILNGTTIISHVEVASSARAGISNFGGAIELGDAALTCNTFDLEAEDYAKVPFSIKNLDGNACGCPAADTECKVVSVGLAPPPSSPPIPDQK